MKYGQEFPLKKLEKEIKNMKFLFICGSLQPGKDGVGDYTRRFCSELIKKNHQVQIIALCDLEINSFVSEKQSIEDLKVQVHRIPRNSPTKQRYILTQEVLNDFRPHLVSLQFVPYSFNPKGLPFWLSPFLKSLKGDHKWHIMFHELWLGIDQESSIKHKLIGKLQQRIIKKVIAITKPTIVNTQNKLYQFHLKSNFIDSVVLPIFGNIPLSGTKQENKEYILFTLFGTIHDGVPFKDFIADLMIISKNFDKPIKFIFIGKNGPLLKECISVLKQNNIDYDVLNIQTEKTISQVLINSDFGISTTPYFQTEKSGVYAAYREHQLTSICVAREWTPTNGQYVIQNIIKYNKSNLNLKDSNLKIFDLKDILMQFINSIPS